MESHDLPTGDASGTAAVRQQESSSAPEAEQKSTAEREARVAELREQYRSGTYQVDAAELSSKIVDEHLKR